jgi:hypothetical protein
MTEQPKSLSEETVDPFNLDALRLSRISPKRGRQKAVRAGLCRDRPISPRRRGEMDTRQIDANGRMAGMDGWFRSLRRYATRTRQ